MKKLMEKFKKMSKKKKIIVSSSVVGVIVLIVATCLIVDYIHDKKILKMSSIDFNSETYKGKKIKVKGNQIIIYEENGSKTIETVNTDKNKMTKATKKIRDSFEISNILVEKKAAKTTISGKVKPKTDDYKKAIISAKFYKNDVLASTASATIKDLKKNKTKEFEISLVGDYSDCTYTIDVEYVD